MGSYGKTTIEYPLREHYPMGFGLSFTYVMSDKSLSVQARCVFSLLSTFVNWSTGENSCFPERETVYGALKISRSRLSDYNRELEKMGYLKIEHRKKSGTVLQDSNRYTLLLRPASFIQNPAAVVVTNDIREYGYGMASKELLLDRSLSLTAKALYLYAVAAAGNISDYSLSLNKTLRDLGISEHTFDRAKAELKKAGYVKFSAAKFIRPNGNIVFADAVADKYYKIGLISRTSQMDATGKTANDRMGDTEDINHHKDAAGLRKNSQSDATVKPENIQEGAVGDSATSGSATAQGARNNNINNNNIGNNNIHPSINKTERTGRTLSYDDVMKIHGEAHLLPVDVISNETTRINFVNGLFRDSRPFLRGHQNVINMAKYSMLDLLNPDCENPYNGHMVSPEEALLYLNDNLDCIQEVIDFTVESYVGAVETGEIRTKRHEAYIRSCLISKLRSGTDDVESDILRDFGSFSDDLTEHGRRFGLFSASP